jgi:TPP-dependent pyruvate/acetoin dehydrogenase alpha subunit
VLIDGTDVDAIAATIKARFDHALVSRFATLVSSGTYRLMWDLAKSEIPT